MCGTEFTNHQGDVQLISRSEAEKRHIKLAAGAVILELDHRDMVTLIALHLAWYEFMHVITSGM